MHRISKLTVYAPQQIGFQHSRVSMRRGAAAVEFAFAFAVLVLVLFGGVELIRINFLRHTVDHAAYAAARVAIIPGANGQDAIARANQHLDAVGVVGARVALKPSTIDESTSEVRVVVTMPVANNSWVIPRYLSGNIIGQSSLLTERPPAQMAANLPSSSSTVTTTSSSVSSIFSHELLQSSEPLLSPQSDSSSSTDAPPLL